MEEGEIGVQEEERSWIKVNNEELQRRRCQEKRVQVCSAHLYTSPHKRYGQSHLSRTHI